MTPLDSDPLEPHERLGVTLHAHVKSLCHEPLYKPFFVDWSGATASKTFDESQDDLMRLVNPEHRGQHLDLSLNVTLGSHDPDRNPLVIAPVIQLLHCIDRDVFHVKHITISINHALFDVKELTELFRLLHEFHDEANVQINLRKGQDMAQSVNLSAWKRIFDLTARTTFPSVSKVSSASSAKKMWEVVVTCGGLHAQPDYSLDPPRIETDARLVAACISALAHASDHVTSVCLRNAIEDKTSDAQEPRDEDVRARWLGYLLRVGAVERLVLEEERITEGDVDLIQSILEAPTRDDCFRLLWKKSRCRLYEECHTDEVTYEHIQNPEDALTDALGVLGLMNDNVAEDEVLSDTDELCVDVFLVGIQDLHLTADDNEVVFPIVIGSRHPLQVLTLDAQLNEQSSGFPALSQCLVRFGVELQELRLRAKGVHRPVAEDALPAVQAMVHTCCRSCETIELSNFAVHYFREIFTQDTVAFPQLATLIFKDAIWTSESLRGLLSALSTSNHPLTRSLCTLDIRIPSFSELGDERVAEMLEKNCQLVNFRFHTHGSSTTRMADTNGILLERPLTARQKAAFLSVMETTKLPWEPFVVAQILRFVPDPTFRRVIVSI